MLRFQPMHQVRPDTPDAILKGGVLYDIEKSTFERKPSSEGRPSTVSLYSNAVFILIVFGWYSSAVVAITTSKYVLTIFPFPFFLCSTQFFCASLITKSISSLLRSEPIPSKFNNFMRQIAVSYTFGFLCTNIAFSLVSANFAETVKSAEPVSSVILGYFVVNEVASAVSYATLVPICVGVGMSCMGEDSFSLFGLVFAALSNICFSYRAVVAKQLYQASSRTIDEIVLFANISVIGFMISCPLAVVIEKESMMEFSNGSFSFSAILVQCVVNGCAYTCYNILSFMALRRSSVITHAVLNVFRRVVIIVFTVFYFDVSLSTLNVCGIIVAVFGVGCYTWTKLYAQNSREL
mmetsp:Transcript_6056/g.9149  ORF Transcript_6056/g.9149 Transcript_6056/m.9149 type:complete len:350 (+) Transcript_6056:85-1134(+)